MKETKKVIPTILEEIRLGPWTGENYDKKRYPLTTNGNGKTGPLLLVLNFPRLTCPLNPPCEHLCYSANDWHLATEWCQKNAGRNYVAYVENPSRFWKKLKFDIENGGFPFFRYFETGDIPDDAFLEGMVKLALELPTVRFVAYTKQYETVLAFLDKGGKIPDNLHLYASTWREANGALWKGELIKRLEAYKVFLAEYIPTVEELEEFSVSHRGHVCACNVGCSACKACLTNFGNVGFIDHNLNRKLKKKK